MLHLNPFSLTWGGDWALYVRLMEGFLRETRTADQAAQEIAALHDPAQSALIVRDSYRSPRRVMRIMQARDCIGFLAYEQDGAQGTVCALYILPECRLMGHGTQALLLAEKALHRLGVRSVSLHAPARTLFTRCGYAPDSAAPDLYRKALPDYPADAVQLLCYTRQPLSEELYAPKLADSVHLALIEGGVCTPLLHNSGIVYARAIPGELDVLHPYSLRKPWLTRLPDGQWAIVAERIETDGSADAASEDHVLLFTSADLIHYAEQPLLHMSDPLVQEYLIQRQTAPDLSGLDLPEGCIPGNAIAIPQEAAQRLRTRFLTPVNVANDVPAQVEASSPADLAAVRAIARYSDGSSVCKRVDWHADHIDWTKPGRYVIDGRVHQDRYEFPAMRHKADPAVCRWQGHYYFISTNDLDGNRTLFMRKADTIPGLVTAQQTCILDADTYPHVGNLLWAPELHIIRGRLYIFHAATPGPFGQEQSHVMALKEGGDPMKAADWEMPRRVVKRDGSMLFDKGITLDMTVFWSASRLYASWSQRQFDPVDLGAWLYIAELDPEHPWQLLSDPRVLTTPEYGWENNHTFVAEGPFALYHGGRILLSYSGALVDSTYVVGLLSIADGADPLELSNWTKENYPLLTSRSVEGEFGPGHNAYVTDEDGLVWNAYHARPGVNGPRSSGFRRVHFNADGFPVLDLAEPLDLKPELAWVSTTLIVR